MRALFAAALSCLALSGPAAVRAQTVPAAGTPTAAARATVEPAVERLVNEDDNVRIEELRVRGQTRSIVVHSKMPGVRSYEILPVDGGRDPSQPGASAGQRVWTFRF